MADFWLKNGMDAEHGGIYTCLDRKGRIYSTDKSVWMQGRCGWTYAYLCHVYGVRDEWLAASKSCIDFLEKYCVNHDAGGRLYFTVTGYGKPLRQRRYCYSEAFYCIANAEYYGIPRRAREPGTSPFPPIPWPDGCRSWGGCPLTRCIRPWS